MLEIEEKPSKEQDQALKEIHDALMKLAEMNFKGVAKLEAAIKEFEVVNHVELEPIVVAIENAAKKFSEPKEKIAYKFDITRNSAGLMTSIEATPK